MLVEKVEEIQVFNKMVKNMIMIWKIMAKNGNLNLECDNDLMTELQS